MTFFEECLCTMLHSALINFQVDLISNREMFPAVQDQGLLTIGY